METLPEDSSRSQTLAPPPDESPPPAAASAAPETLAVPVLDYHELGLGSPPGGSPEPAAAGDAFAVGDFVWAKIKSHPWWPGQVYDPSRASESASSAHRKDQSFLVACFGDASFAWVEPAQLKPFRAEEFGEMARQSAAKGFVAAVLDALSTIGKRLAVQLRCRCVPEEAACGVDGDVPVENYTARDFLERLLDVACDVSECDVLEAAMLSSWAVAVGKLSFSSGEFKYCLRRGVAELVDKVDVDAVMPVETVVEEQGLEGSGIAKKPVMSEEELSRGRKRRSMAKLIAEMDLDAIEISDEGEEENADVNTEPSSSKQKKGKDSESLDVDIDTMQVEEATGSGSSRRERKKSKYLSPPYMYPSGSSWRPASIEDAELKTPKKTNEASQFLLFECNSAMFQADEAGMKSPVYKIDSMSGAEILFEFLCTALDPFHLKWNRSAKTVRGFFNLYRNSVYSSGLEFDDYQKHLENCGATGGKSANKDLADRSEERKPERKRKKGRSNGSSLPDSGPRTAKHSEQVKTGLKRKKRKEEADGASPLDLGQNASTNSDQRKAGSKRMAGKNGADGVSPSSVGQECTDASEKRKKAEPKRKLKKGQASDETQLGLVGQDGVDPSEQGKEAGHSKDGAVKETSLDLVGQDRVNSSEQGKKAGLKRKMNDGIAEETPLGLVLDASGPSEQVKDGPRGKTTSTMKALVDLNLQIATGQEEDNPQMIKKGNSGANGERIMDSGQGVINGMGAVDATQIKDIGKEVNSQNNPTELAPVLVDCHESGEMAEDSPVRQTPVEPGSDIKNGRKAGTTKPGHKRKKRDAPTYGNPTSLLLTFAPGINLPTKEHFNSTFSKYGELVESETELLKESGCARVVFSNGKDAEKAFNSLDKSTDFGYPAPSYRLCSLPGNLSTLPQIPIPKPPLPYIRKSLERMISTLSESSSPTEKDAGTSEVLKPEAKQNLVGEMQGLLQKVNNMLNGPAAGVPP